jgi:hypothetical protein
MADLQNKLVQDNAPVKSDVNGFPIADSPVRQRVDATRQMQGGGPVEEEPAEEGRGMMDYIHSGLDVAGMVPGLGIIPDIANAALYGGEALLAGDEPSRSEALALMGMSGAAAVPVLGQAATAGKWAVKGAKSAKRTRDILKQSKGVKYSAKVGDEEWDLSEGALGRLKKFYGDKYPSEMAVTAKFPKAGKQSAYEAGITPSGKFIPKGYQEGGEVEEEGEGVTKEKYLGLLRNMSEAFGSPVREELFTPEGGYSELGFAEKLGFAPETMDIDTLSYSGPGTYNFRISGKTPKGEKLSGTTRSIGMLPLKQHATSAMEGAIEDPFERLHYQVGLKNIEESLGGYQQGGPVYGYKNGGQVKRDVATGDWGGEQGDYMKALEASRDSTMSPQELKSMALMDHFRKMGTGERMESSDMYNGEPAYKSEEAYKRAFGMQTPLNAKERFTQIRLGLNPETFSAQQRGLLGKALLQRLGNEVQ